MASSDPDKNRSPRSRPARPRPEAGLEGPKRPLLSISETAQYLGIGRQTVYDMAAEGRLPVVRPTRGKRTIKVVRALLDDIVAAGLLGEVLEPR